MDIYIKYQLLKDNYDFACKENEKLRNEVRNQDRQIENLKKRIDILEGKYTISDLRNDIAIKTAPNHSLLDLYMRK